MDENNTAAPITTCKKCATPCHRVYHRGGDHTPSVLRASEAELAGVGYHSRAADGGVICWRCLRTSLTSTEAEEKEARQKARRAEKAKAKRSTPAAIAAADRRQRARDARQAREENREQDRLDAGGHPWAMDEQ